MQISRKQHCYNRIHEAAQVFVGMEPLEGRTLMSAVHFGMTPPTYALVNQTIPVTNTQPSGAGSLNAAIAAADNSPYLNVDITFQLPGYDPTITSPASNPLPTISRSNVTIDGTTQYGGVTLNASGGTIFGFLLEASNCTIKGVRLNNFADGIGVYAGSNNVFTQDSTVGCTDGITLDAQSNSNTITGCGFYNSGQDAIYVGGQNNYIGTYSGALNLVSGSNGNGIEVNNSNNFVINNFVHGCGQDCLVLDSGSNTTVQANGFSQGLIAEGDHGKSHGSCIDVKAGANGNLFGETFGVGSIGLNRITYADLGATPGSYAITVQGTNNQIIQNRVILNDGSSPSESMQDIYIGYGNTYQPF